MASPALLRGRVSDLGAIYSVTTVCAGRLPMLLDLRAATPVIAEIGRSQAEGAIDCLAWVVMPDHVHWLFELRTASLSRVMQRFKSRSGHAVNVASGHVGAVWQPGFHDHRVRDERDLRVRARYLVENPVRRRLVEQIDAYPHWWCRWIVRGSDLA